MRGLGRPNIMYQPFYPLYAFLPPRSIADFHFFGNFTAPIVAEAAKEQGILTVGVVTKPFAFEGRRRMMQAEKGIEDLRGKVRR